MGKLSVLILVASVQTLINPSLNEGNWTATEVRFKRSSPGSNKSSSSASETNYHSATSFENDSSLEESKTPISPSADSSELVETNVFGTNNRPNRPLGKYMLDFYRFKYGNKDNQIKERMEKANRSGNCAKNY